MAKTMRRSTKKTATKKRVWRPSGSSAGNNINARQRGINLNVIPTDAYRFPLRQQSQMYTMTKTVCVVNGIAVVTTGTPVGGAVATTLATAFPTDYTSLQNLFDEYRIEAVEITAYPTKIQAITSGGLYASNGQLQTVIDFDDDVVPTTANTLLNYGTCISTEGNVKVVRAFVPKVQIATVDAVSGATLGSAAKAYQWIDMGNATVKHYGFKWFFNSQGGTAYDLMIKTRISFRSTR